MPLGHFRFVEVNREPTTHVLVKHWFTVRVFLGDVKPELFYAYGVTDRMYDAAQRLLLNTAKRNRIPSDRNNTEPSGRVSHSHIRPCAPVSVITM